ncbi:MAG: long-chain-fatty-acid--CoA ligase [Thermodesulfobacteriota bacterium]
MTTPNLTEHVKRKKQNYADRLFLSDLNRDTRYTYEAFDQETDRMAWGLGKLGISRGDRVALLHPNHTDFVLAYMAIIKAGGVAVPVNTTYTGREVAYILNDAGSRMVITTAAFKALLEGVRPSIPALERIIMKEAGEPLARSLEKECGALKGDLPGGGKADDLAFIFYTSGTTGSPKGVMLTHRNLVFGGGNTAQNYGLRETDVTLACLPLVHIFANASPVFGSLNSGGTVVVMERFQTELVMEAMEREGVTWFPGVPTMFGYLLNAFEERPRRTPTLRMALSGGASLSAEHLTRFESRFQAPVLEVYGLTESTGLVTANPVYGIRKVGAIGVNVSGVSTRLVDKDSNDVVPGEVGELVFRGPNATPGYWNRPEVTAAAINDGWVRTGDLARQDEDGYYFIVGRKDEMLISGGYNIYPREIEEVLYLHEEISEAAVVGVKDPNLGEVPKAFVSLKEGSRLTADAIVDFCRLHLAAYKVPRQVTIMASLPKNTTGKILKKELASKTA